MIPTTVPVRLGLSLLVAFLIWRLLRRIVFPGPFDRIPGPPKASFISGNLPQLFARNSLEFHRSLAQTYGRVVKTVGLFGSQSLYVHDSKALHHIFVKDQHIFEESVTFIAGNKLIFGDGLLSTLGDHHRKQRKMLNPVFSIVHMRSMIPTFFEITYKLRDVFLRQTAGGPKENCFGIVGQSGLGTSFDTMSEDHSEHQFITSVKLLGPVARMLAIPRLIVTPLLQKYKLGPPRFLRFIMDTLPWKTLHKARDIVDIMHSTSLEIFNSKKKALEEGKDLDQKHILGILMRENAKAVEEDKLPDGEVLAQISTFMFAAMDTTSSALSRILWLLATHRDVQEKLRAEIRAAKKNYEEPNYDQLSSLPYLDAVCRESLRLHPPVSAVLREARKNTILPLSKPIKLVDGTETQELHIPKDTKVLVSILASNTNPELWGSDSYEWKPERWLSPLPATVTEAHIPGIYSNLMTFIGGGRACIGFKFSQMEMKVILYILIDFFQFGLAKQEIFWFESGIATPSIDHEKLRPEMPLVVSRAD